MKFVILVGDGMGDLGAAELGGATPLQAASTPAMDFLSRHGELFRLRTIPAGMEPGSDVANLSLLGYRPERFYTGRAPLEAASMGIELAADEIACRCNLVNLERGADGSVTMVDYSGGHISTAEAHLLIDTLSQKLGTEKLRFYPGISYRHLLVHKGSLAGLVTVPPHDYTGRDVTRYWQQYQAAPVLQHVMEKAGLLLADHEVNLARQRQGQLAANGIWLWGEGRAPSMPTLAELYGISGSLISAVDLLKGIGVYGGLEIIDVPGATGYLDTNYAGKAAAALAALVEKDFVFVHVEAPDEAGHQGLLPEKIRAIEDFDRQIVKPVFDGLKELPGQPDFRLVVAMDHFTPVRTRTHATEPVPMVLYDSRRKEGCGLDYNEENGRLAGELLDNGQLFFEKLLGRI